VSETALADWLGGLTAAGPPFSVAWGRGRHQLNEQIYATTAEPPDHLISSVRAVVFRRGAVMVLRDPAGDHIIPGGRREPGESQMQTLVREIAEETGWRFVNAKRFGFLHFRHLSPKPDNYPYPYPDFFQTLYVVEATDHDRRRIQRDDWETHSRMTSIARALASLGEEQPAILRLAVAAREP
jgi:8-oxo-dGTP pyrophosphatase MutT (NUDIX family)